ncbi:glycosyltransferase family 1 protein [bacterium C-53]|nr:glycosyltransferase family 1 protein [Lachnospiraceae bacterium]NBI02602.1 glycosyltransferase family 1 protein [Lachnospiraceae bacterium]RKJ11244.1 glycosyltransferase family 1 protein [bacterium C-53]
MLEKQLIKKLKKAPHIIIYGAGMVGELVYKRLAYYGLTHKILCFAVTNQPMQSSYLGIPLRRLDELTVYNRTAVVVVAALPKLHDEMRALLVKYSFYNIILTKSVLYQSLSGNYIREFLKNKKDDREPVDVVLMASDNNSSSGAFLCMADLGYELNAQGVRCRVILPEYGDGEKILIDRGIDYTYVPSEHWCIYKDDSRIIKILKLSQNRKAVKRLQKYFCRHNVQLIHNNTTYTYVGAVAAERERLPVVWHLRENIANQSYDFMHREQALKWINHSNRIIVISNYMARSIGGICDRKVKIIYDGVDIKRHYFPRTILENKDRVTITMVGTIIEHKRQEELLQAAVILKKEWPVQFQIRFVGKEEGSYIKKLKGIIERYQLQDVACFLGKQDKVEEFYRMADIAVMCSKDEAFGRTTVEALLAGCLVIGADSGATAELIQDGATGMLYQPENARDLAAHIIQAVKDPQAARRIAKAGQERARKIYSKENNADEVIKVYQKISGRKMG